MYENGVVIEVAAVLDKVLQLEDGSLALRLFAQRHTDLLI